MTDFPETYAFIPARGGSKGIPGKNLQLIGGVTLVGRAVDAALASKRVSRVFVSTDDDDISIVAQSHGAEVVNRPVDIAGDFSSSESALIHALNVLERKSLLPENLVFLQCTSPFTNGDQIDKVLAALDDSNVNSSFSVAPWHGFLWHGDGRGLNHDPYQPRQRRQDLVPAFIETGAIYAMRTKVFHASGNRFCAPWLPVVVNDSGPEIDTPLDLEVCRAIYSALNN